MKAAPPAPERVIRRYDNRKLYDAQARRYVTLEELARLVAAGTDVRVVEQRTGEDITTVVLAQVVLEGIKQRTADIPHQVLSRLIRLGSGKAGGFTEWLDPQEASTRARHEAERIVSGLVTRGRLTLDEALALRQDIAGSAQRLAAEAQAGVQARVRRLLDSADAGVTPALQALKERLSTFEDLLAPPRAPARRRTSPARKSRKKSRRRK
ncbi:MAG TPA: polyhydroxyalkanoate synthesis regulator DNA-binding domain-containing protein [Vicinamibacteria bacterium]|nr:polyhydroxyalkanoate synthesis regulator DNA-binding domain-containing protein [Vicinamibacteria bacterium]